MAGDYKYIDGVGSVRVVNGMAHIGLVVVEPPAAGGGTGVDNTLFNRLNLQHNSPSHRPFDRPRRGR